MSRRGSYLGGHTVLNIGIVNFLNPLPASSVRSSGPLEDIPLETQAAIKRSAKYLQAKRKVEQQREELLQRYNTISNLPKEKLIGASNKLRTQWKLVAQQAKPLLPEVRLKHFEWVWNMLTCKPSENKPEPRQQELVIRSEPPTKLKVQLTVSLAEKNPVMVKNMEAEIVAQQRASRSRTHSPPPLTSVEMERRLKALKAFHAKE